MKKQEFIHLHGLFDLVRSKEFEDEENSLLEDYDEAGVEPTSIHKSKSDHKKAVFQLLNGITEEIENPEKDQIEHIREQLSGTPTPQGTEDVLDYLVENRGEYNSLVDISDDTGMSHIEISKAFEYLDGEYDVVELDSYQRAKIEA